MIAVGNCDVEGSSGVGRDCRAPINTTGDGLTLFIARSKVLVVGCHCAMIRLIVITLCVASPAVFAIIVTDPPPEYTYSYNIEDPTTGDTKTQQEIKLGDVVRGSYSVLDPDGVKRIVDYVADSKNGFTATVRKEPTNIIINPNTRTQYFSEYPYELQNSQDYEVVERASYKSAPTYDPWRSTVTRYFTPANEIKVERKDVFDGHYFAPAT